MLKLQCPVLLTPPQYGLAVFNIITSSGSYPSSSLSLDLSLSHLHWCCLGVKSLRWITLISPSCLQPTLSYSHLLFPFLLRVFGSVRHFPPAVAVSLSVFVPSRLSPSSHDSNCCSVVSRCLPCLFRVSHAVELSFALAFFSRDISLYTFILQTYPKAHSPPRLLGR